MKVRVLVVDDHRMVREALRNRIELEPDLEVVAQAATGREALERMSSTPVDVALLDIALPGLSGLETARIMRQRHPEVGVVAVSGYSDRMFVDEMLEAGARAYVSKCSGTEELIAAIRAVVQGKRYLCPEAATALVGRFERRDGESAPRVDVLTPREREVLAAIARGGRAADIGAGLGISIGTVEVHRRNIKAKLGLRTTAELTRYAVREGLARA